MVEARLLRLWRTVTFDNNNDLRHLSSSLINRARLRELVQPHLNPVRNQMEIPNGLVHLPAEKQGSRLDLPCLISNGVNHKLDDLL